MKNVDFIKQNHPDSIIAEGFDAAIVGYDAGSGIVIYNYDLCVDILIESGLSLDEAHEHMEYNVVGSKYGDLTPIFMHPFTYQLKHSHAGKHERTHHHLH